MHASKLFFIIITQHVLYYTSRLFAENQRMADWSLRPTTAVKRFGFALEYVHVDNVFKLTFEPETVFLDLSKLGAETAYGGEHAAD